MNKASCQMKPLLVLLLLAYSLTCNGQTVVGQITGGIDQARKAVASGGVPREDREPDLKRLKDSEEALRSGDTYFSLYLLQPISTDVALYAYTRSKALVEKQGLSAFEREWRLLGTQLKAKENLFDENALMKLPA